MYPVLTIHFAPDGSGCNIYNETDDRPIGVIEDEDTSWEVVYQWALDRGITKANVNTIFSKTYEVIDFTDHSTITPRRGEMTISAIRRFDDMIIRRDTEGFSVMPGPEGDGARMLPFVAAIEPRVYLSTQEGEADWIHVPMDCDKMLEIHKIIHEKREVPA